MKKKPAVVTPTCDNTATMIGPTTREPLMTTLFSERAPGRSTGRTSDGNMADHAGAFRALPIPTPSAAKKMKMNLGSCLEAMGNYEDAMKHYKDSLSVSEMASPGTLRVMVCAARHLPHVMKGGELQMIDGKLEWVEQGESCDTYVEVELVEEVHLGNMSRSKPARTKVAKKNYQPTWNQMLTIQSERGDRSVVVRLMGRNPQRFALEEAAAQKRKQIQGLCMTLLRPSKRASVAQCLLLHTIACIGPAEIDKGREEGWRRECVCLCAPVWYSHFEYE